MFDRFKKTQPAPAATPPTTATWLTAARAKGIL